jgi:hypothetical protein
VVESIAMTSVRAPVSLLRHDSTTVSRLSPGPPRRHDRTSGGATLDSGRNFKPGRPKSLGHRSADPPTAAGSGHRGTTPRGCATDRSGHDRPLPACLVHGHLFSAGPVQPHQIRAVVRSPRRREDDSAVRIRPARRRSRRGLDPSRGRAHLLSRRPDPGPRRPGRSGVDTNASTLGDSRPDGLEPYASPPSDESDGSQPRCVAAA